MEQLYAILGIPLGFLLTLIYNVVQNYGLALILLTVFARILMVPTTISQQKGMAKSQRLQPKIRRIQAKYAGNQQRIQQETQALYQREGQNPMNMGCLPMAIQMPLLFGMIGAIYYPLQYPLGIDKDVINVLVEAAKEFVPKLSTGTARSVGLQGQFYVMDHIKELAYLVPEKISQVDYDAILNFRFSFLGLPLGARPDWGSLAARDYQALKLWLVPLSSFATSMASSTFSFLKQRKNMPQAPQSSGMMGCMSFGMPLFSLLITFQFPVGIGVYWTVGNIIAFIQTVILSYTHNPKKLTARLMVEDTIERRSKEANQKKVVEMKTK